ncbi:MAG: hypothetical protein OWQ55_09450 [Sulfuracidifex metallicus]|nr:hypothetical protein [Sulfuracidifex metallicus]
MLHQSHTLSFVCRVGTTEPLELRPLDGQAWSVKQEALFVMAGSSRQNRW